MLIFTKPERFHQPAMHGCIINALVTDFFGFDKPTLSIRPRAMLGQSPSKSSVWRPSSTAPQTSAGLVAALTTRANDTGLCIELEKLNT